MIGWIRAIIAGIRATAAPPDGDLVRGRTLPIQYTIVKRHGEDRVEWVGISIWHGTHKELADALNSIDTNYEALPPGYDLSHLNLKGTHHDNHQSGIGKHQATQGRQD